VAAEAASRIAVGVGERMPEEVACFRIERGDLRVSSLASAKQPGSNVGSVLNLTDFESLGMSARFGTARPEPRRARL